MPQEVVVGILIALVVVLGILFLLPKPNPEVEIVKFLAETLSKDYAVRFGDFRGETPYEEAAAKVFIAEILSRNGYMIADRERFFKTRWEEQALADLGLVRDLNFGKPEMARYSVAVDALKDSLKISVGDLSSSLVRTRVFPLPDRYKKLLEAVYGISPRVIELRHEYQQKDILVKMIVNYPFTEKIAVTVNNNTYGVYSVTREEFSFKIQDVRPGASYDVALTPMDRRNRPGIVFSRRIIAELPPEPVISMSSSVSSGRIIYTWTHPNTSYPDLRFVVDTPFGRYTTTSTSLSEELRYGKLYTVRITAVGKYGQSETKSFVVKTPPEKPQVRAEAYFDTIRLYITNTNDYEVKYVISVDGKRFEINKNYFEYKVPVPGLPYKVEVQAFDGQNYSSTEALEVRTKTPMFPPTVKASIVSGTLVITVEKVNAIDLKEYRIIVNGKEVSKSTEYAETAQPDTVYDIRVRWVNRDNDMSPETRVVLETFPLPPEVSYSQSGNDLILELRDPSKNVKAEGFEVTIDGKTYKTSGKLVLENFANGKTYTVVAHAVRGNYKTPAKIVQVPTVSRIIPAPTLKTVTVLEGVVTLEWNAQTPFDFSHFRIVRKSSADEKVYQSAIGRLSDSGVPNGKSFTYVITTVNKSGIQSPPLEVKVNTFPERPKVSYKYEPGKVIFNFENQCEYNVTFKVERGGQEVYRGMQNSFVDNVKADGSKYVYRVYAISGTFQSRPVEVTVTAHSPLVAPKVNVSRTAETIIITVVRPDVRDYRESYIEVDGNVYKTEVLSLKNEPDKVYKVKAYWSNTSGQKSEATELILETSPKPPIVEYRVDGANVILKITDPSTVIKAEKFVVIYGSRTIEVLKGEATIQIDTSKTVHEFKVYGVYKDLQSPQTSVIVVLRN